jgi:hypothetical protein
MFARLTELHLSVCLSVCLHHEPNTDSDIIDTTWQAGPSGRAVWALGPDHLDAETVDSKLA